jgi:citrate synthase
MDDRKQEYLSLLNRKLDALANMLEATQMVQITGTGDDNQLEEEASSFSNLYEHRANIFEEIEKMDESLAQLKDLESDKEFAAACQSITDKMKNIVMEMMELDKKNIEASKKLTEFLKGHIKRIRDGRVGNKYVDVGESTSGYYFDKTH